MNRFASLSDEKRSFYVQQAADRLGLPPASVEKDFWVCWTLAKLFASDLLAPKILFKGGTSLSKVFGLIRRFSEDIDLVLDWNEVVPEDPNLARSKTRQDGFNNEVSGAGGVEAVYADENVWLSQKMMGQLYAVETHTVNYHLKKVFEDNELQVDSVIR